MPRKNVKRNYVAGAVYHIYNRGVDKREIFLDERDYSVFLHYLKVFLSPPDPDPAVCPAGIARRPRRYNLHDRVTLLAYCLMPNHFHLLLRQKDEKAMTEFMKRLGNAYVEYFNPRRKRIGPLYQGPYRAVLIDDDTHYPWLSAYIHRNPIDLLAPLGLKSLAEYPYSSYANYLDLRHTTWLNREPILEQFRSDRRDSPYGRYRQLVEEAEITNEGILAGKLLD